MATRIVADGSTYTTSVGFLGKISLTRMMAAFPPPEHSRTYPNIARCRQEANRQR